VADWAVNPIDGYLYGADYTPDSVIYKLDPTDGSVSNLGHPEGLPAGVAYGGAWFNAAGVLFVFRNNDEIYQIDVTQSPPEMLNSLEGETDSSTYNDAAACAVYDTPGPPSSDKYYTYTNNNWAERCVEYDIEENCISWRQANIDLDEGVFAAPLPQNDDDEFVLLGKEIGTKKTVVNPGQYFAVVNVEVTEEQDVLVEENFSDCLDIGTVNPFSVPGGVQVVLIDESGDVYQIDGDLAQDIGGYITLTEGTVDVFVEAVPANSTLRVMVKFQPSDAVGIISSSCTNTADISDGGEESPIATASAGLVIQER